MRFLMLESGAERPISEGFPRRWAEKEEGFTWRNPQGASRLCSEILSWWITPRRAWERSVTGHEEPVAAGVRSSLSRTFAF